jgi:predicted RNA-binding Zn-ribbon protein involved in translation (DUF1610 family)
MADGEAKDTSYECDSCGAPVEPLFYANRHGASRVRWTCPKCGAVGYEAR